MTENEARRHEALLAERSGMAEKIRHATLDLYRTETIIPLSIAVFYAWLYDDGQDIGQLPSWVLLIPVALAALGAARQYMRYHYLECAHNYLKLLERKLYPASDDNDLGWEAYWADNDRSPHRAMRIIFWILLLSATTALAAQAWYGATPRDREREITVTVR